MHTCPEQFRGETVQESKTIYDYDGNEVGYMVAIKKPGDYRSFDGIFIDSRWATEWLTKAAMRIGQQVRGKNSSLDFYSFLNDSDKLEWAVLAVENPTIFLSVMGPEHTEDTIFHSARKRLDNTGEQRFTLYNLEKRIEFNGLEEVLAESGSTCPFCEYCGIE